MENRVFIAKCDDYDKCAGAVERVFDAFGGAEELLGLTSGSSGTGKKVLIKPNLLMPRKPEDATTTHPAVVEAVCAAFVKAGADVSIIDSTGGPHTKFVLKLLYGKTGMKDAAEKSGAKVSLNTKTKTVSFPEGRILQNFALLAPVLEADLVISLAKAKTHGFMAMTGAVKNMFGCIPGLGKPNLHRKHPKREDFAGMLVDICAFIKPGLSIVDGVYGMEGPGPAGGDPKLLGAVFGGISPYAVDLAQCHLMGLRTDSIYTIAEAVSRGLSPSDPAELSWLGDDKEPLRSNFKPAAKHKSDAVPKIKENCTGCGDCMRICPAKCIKMENKLAVIKERDCIRCYCCHEFCTYNAIEL